jgi:hypothetical protein
MKRVVIIIICAVVAMALLFTGTGILVHKKRAAESVEVETFRAPPEGLNEDQTMDFYINNSTYEESAQLEDGKEVVEEQYSTCRRYSIGSRLFSSRSSCYTALYNLGCRYPCLINTHFKVGRNYQFQYYCWCW